MKNYYFSLILFFTVCLTAAVANSLASSEINRYIAALNLFSNITTITDSDRNRIADLKYEFENKKNMLRLIISKEHINNIETNILLIENNIKNDSIEDIQSKSLESIAILKQIKEYLVAVN